MPPAPDTLLQTWILAWDIHALTTDPLHLYDANVYFPFPLPLTYSDAMLSGALMIAPVLIVTGNPVLAHNVLTLASMAIAGLGMYLLVRALSGSDIGGLVAGCIFGFCASRQSHLAHVNLLQFGWLPLALLCLHRAVRQGRTLDLLLFALFTVCQALASVYLAWMMAIAYAIFFAVEVVSRRTAWKLDNMVRIGCALVLAAIIVVPVMWPYERMQEIYGFQWPREVIGEFSAVLSDYLSVPTQNLVYTPILHQFTPSQFATEHILFPGFAALVLTLIAVGGRSINVELVRYSLIGIVAFVLSFGPSLRLESGTETIPLPYFYLLQHVPGFAVMRVPARFDFLLMLALGILAGFGTARLSTALSRRTGAWTRRSILVGVVVVTLLELLPRPQSVESVAVQANVPPVYSWLKAQAPDAVVAEIPAHGRSGFENFEYMYMSTYHWHPLVNGSSGFEPPASKAVANELDAFPDPVAVANLRSLGVRYLIAHLDKLESTEIHRLNDADLTQLRLGIVATFGQDVAYEFGPLADPPTLRDHVQLELPELVGRDTTPFVSVAVSNNTPYPLFVGAPEAMGAQIEWNHDGKMQAARQDLPVFFEPNRTIRLVFPAQLSSSLTAADSGQLTVRLTGSVQLEASQNVRIANLPTSLERTALSARLEHVQLPNLVHASTWIPVEITARNTGHAVWLPEPPGASGTKGVVGVSIRSWIEPDGKGVPASADSTAHVLWDVNPDQVAALTVQTLAPSVTGHYNLVIDMLSESVTWFDDVKGGARTVVPVDVVP